MTKAGGVRMSGWEDGGANTSQSDHALFLRVRIPPRFPTLGGGSGAGIELAGCRGQFLLE